MQRSKTKVTMDDIARRLNISKNPVSLALGKKKGVSDALRKQIEDAAREMNYGGFAPENIKSRCVVSIVPEYIHNDAYFYSDIFWSIEKESKKNNYVSIMTGITRGAEAELDLPQTPPEMDVAGYFVIGIVNPAYVVKLLETGRPVVAVDIRHHRVPVRSVTSSNLSGGFAATMHLIESGHTQIGFIGPVYAAQSIYERWCGFKQAMDFSGVELKGDYDITGNKNEFKLFDAVEALEPLVDSVESLPTAWFCAGDRIAISLINILTRRKIKIPEEISVIGFDDIPMAQMVFPALTTMRVDRRLMGKLAFNALIEPRYDFRRNINLSSVLVERDSVRKIK